MQRCTATSGHSRPSVVGAHTTVHVRFALKADKEAGIALSPLCAIRGLAHRSKTALSFDHLVGADHQRQRHVDAEAEARKLATYFLKQADPQPAE